MKSYEIVIGASAKKELRKLPKEAIAVITKAILALEGWAGFLIIACGEMG